MPKLKDHALPRYRLHKQSGQAIVTLSGRDHLLGEHNSTESVHKYRQLTAEWQKTKGAARAPQGVEWTLEELLAGFLRHAEIHYRKNGRQTSEYSIYLMIMGPLRQLYGELPVSRFGPLKLQAVIAEMVRLRWARTAINNHIHRIRNIFRWGVTIEKVPVAVHSALECVPALQKGRTSARETAKVLPVEDHLITAVLPHVPPTVAGMILVQRYTGMRPGEVCIIRGCDLSARDSEVWEYRPESHKTEHRGKQRVVDIGPRAQPFLEPWLGANHKAYLFSPAEAEAERRAKRHSERRTPLRYGNSPGTNCRPDARPIPVHYSVVTYRHAIVRGCERAFGMPADLREPRTKAAKAADSPEKKADRRRRRTEWHTRHVWHPNQLRHTFGTNVRDAAGAEAAQMALGHAHVNTAEIYAEKSRRAAREIALRVG